ncbi:39S ribosomal protein L22, mitochondrial isoform X2 [Hypomesus transpacificus]|uniref:39S ribosomal protein L22, mitochondrial isoform X2 n=1 Tax=Hypomesus transpacificus TaxID=137520 RepID=UPI001F07B9F3|nr:39S ribosomal protein L22, mitochondrial isoform X2 [Hypomesus transpacificus]
MAASIMTGGGFTFLRGLVGQIQPRLLAFGGTLQISTIHTSTALDSSKNWERKNLTVYPPQLSNEPRRAAIKGLSIDEAIAQLEFNDKKGAKIMKEVLQEAQEMAVRNHNVEYKSNLFVADAFTGKGKYLKRIRYHGRGRFGIMDKVHCHFFVKLMEGVPPKVEEKTGFDLAKDYVQQLKNRTIIHSL